VCGRRVLLWGCCRLRVHPMAVHASAAASSKLVRAGGVCASFVIWLCCITAHKHASRPCPGHLSPLGGLLATDTAPAIMACSLTLLVSRTQLHMHVATCVGVWFCQMHASAGLLAVSDTCTSQPRC
jgi:hypothetical protein